MTDHLDIETHDYSRITGGSEAYDFGPQILHLPILLILHTLFHRFWTIMTQANLQTFIDITVTGDLAMEPPWLFWPGYWEYVCCTNPGPRLYISNCYIEVASMTIRNDKQWYKNPSKLTKAEYKEGDIRFWAPDPKCDHSNATYQLSWWVLINDVLNSPAIWNKHTHGWQISYWSTVNQITPINLQKHNNN